MSGYTPNTLYSVLQCLDEKLSFPFIWDLVRGFIAQCQLLHPAWWECFTLRCKMQEEARDQVIYHIANTHTVCLVGSLFSSCSYIYTFSVAMVSPIPHLILSRLFIYFGNYCLKQHVEVYMFIYWGPQFEDEDKCEQFKDSHGIYISDFPIHMHQNTFFARGILRIK